MTLENFVMEQSINTSSVDDILLEQAIAEFEVANAIFECYKKEEILQEYVTNPSEFGVFMESDESAETSADDAETPTKKNPFKTAGKFITNKAKAGGAWLSKAWNLLVTAVKRFVQVTFVDVDFGKIADAIDKKFDDDQTFDLSLRPFVAVQQSSQFLEKLAENRKHATGTATTDWLQKLYDLYHNNPAVSRDDNEKSITKAALVEELNNLNACRDKFNKFKNIATSGGEDAVAKDSELSDEYRDLCVKFYKELTDDYIEAAKLVKKCVNLVAREAHRANKKSEADQKRNEKDAVKQAKKNAADKKAEAKQYKKDYGVKPDEILYAT